MQTIIKISAELLEKAKRKTGIYDTDELISFALLNYFEHEQDVFFDLHLEENLTKH